MVEQAISDAYYKYNFWERPRFPLTERGYWKNVFVSCCKPPYLPTARDENHMLFFQSARDTVHQFSTGAYQKIPEPRPEYSYFLKDWLNKLGEGMIDLIVDICMNDAWWKICETEIKSKPTLFGSEPSSGEPTNGESPSEPSSGDATNGQVVHMISESSPLASPGPSSDFFDIWRFSEDDE
jgi:hypothetical protein